MATDRLGHRVRTRQARVFELPAQVDELSNGPERVQLLAFSYVTRFLGREELLIHSQLKVSRSTTDELNQLWG